MSRVQKEFYVNDQKDAASIKHIDESSQKSGQLEDVEPEGGRRSLPGLQTSTESTPFKVHFKTWIIVFASSLAFCAYVWCVAHVVLLATPVLTPAFTVAGHSLHSV